ncbi:MAG: fibronectin type III domain-containing protein, partial [Akkermansiaceae bacterium]
MKSRTLARLALALLTITLPATAETITRGPYLQLATESSVHVVWRTKSVVTPSVRYGSTPNKLDQVCPGESIIVRRTEEHHKASNAKPLFKAPEGTRQFEAKISGLKPDTRYYYAVYDGDKRLTPAETGYYFRTHPVRGKKRDAYIWVVGDSGTGNAFQKQVHQALIDHNKKH